MALGGDAAPTSAARAGDGPAGGGGSLEAGRVGRAHGLDGSFYVTRAVPTALELGAQVQVGGRCAAIVRRAGVDKHPILRLEGVNDRESAAALRGQTLLVARPAAPALQDDEYWAHELEGCAVVSDSGSVGVVARMIALPSCEALQVTRPDGGELLVPLVRDAIEEIDTPARRIRVNTRFLGLEG